MTPETFWTLLHDSAHWQFELFVGFVEMLVFDGFVGFMVWPFIKKHWKHHIDRDSREAVQTVAHSVLGVYGIREDAVISWTLTNESLTVVLKAEPMEQHLLGGAWRVGK